MSLKATLMFKLRSLSVLLLLGLSGVCYACQVPVFRYALERWKADPYRIVVLHEGRLDERIVAEIQTLRTKADHGELKSYAGAAVSVVDLRETSDPRLLAVKRLNPEVKLPILAAFYPSKSDAPADSPAYVEAFDQQSAAKLFTSPARAELARRLLKGHSAVWLFLPCGDKEKDASARERLEKQLALDATRLELPSAEEMEIEPEVLAAAKIKLAVEFSVLTIERTDPREVFLVDALLHSESDLLDYDEPLAFPVFGRGRVLYALVGNGIQRDTIRAASTFIVGPCSCQVKDQNPGFDLLMNVPWDSAVGSTLISEPIETSDPGSPPRRLTIPPGNAPKR